MSEVHVEIEIATPVQRVWETIMNPDRLKDWVTIHRSVGHVSEPLTKGSTMEQELRMRGVSFKVNWTLVDVSAPTTAQWDGRGPARSRARIRYELSPRGDDRTLFKYTNAFTPPGGMLGNVASRVIVGAASEREANGSLSRLKALLERD
ncbi:MAG: SRPBCC family protein [Solirubrobacteraceae bacterium]